MRLFIVPLALALGGCAFHADQNRPAPSVPPPPVVVDGPKFPTTAFACQAEPAPPDPAGDDKRQGSAAALDREALVAWGRCNLRKLNSLARRLDGAGLVDH